MRVVASLAAALSLASSSASATRRTESDFLVRGLEDVEPAYAEFASKGRMFSGMMPVDDTDTPRAEIMFWLFEPDIDLDSLVVWFNGGPGCSSFQGGVLFECSPVTTPHYPAGYPKTRFDEPLTPNEQSWTKATNMLFVEQPAGIGFSKGPLPKDEHDVSKDFYDFLIQFYATFPRMKPKKLFLFGESYAGMYVPSMAYYIHKKNANSDNKVNLSGIALGNGWVDARIQGPAVIDYAWWHGMIDLTTREALHRNWKGCLAGDPMLPPFHDFTVPDECNTMGAVLEAAGAGIFPELTPNAYDVTTWDTYPVLDDPNSTYMKFYNNPKVKKILHAPDDVEWHGCIPGAGRRLEELPGKLLLADDRPISTVPYIAELLEDDIRVLVYSGDRDMSTNAQGSELALSGMRWSGVADWKSATRSVWMVQDKVAGYAKSHGGLDFVIVYNSGHLVPYNVPVEALDLVTRFVNDQSFSDIELPKIDLSAKVKHSNHHHSNKKLRHGQIMEKLIIALICFSAGMFASSLRRRRGYEGVRNIPNDLSPLTRVDSKSIMPLSPTTEATRVFR